MEYLMDGEGYIVQGEGMSGSIGPAGVKAEPTAAGSLIDMHEAAWNATECSRRKA